MSDNLKVTGTASPIAISEGTAWVHDAIIYWNTECEYMEIPTPVSSTRIDCIVLRTDWKKQTVRLARIAGIEGEGPPALTDVEGDIQDTLLARCLITLDGTIAVFDEYVWKKIKAVAPSWAHGTPETNPHYPYEGPAMGWVHA